MVEMSIGSLIENLAEILEIDEKELEPNAVLQDLEQWDSFSVLSVVALVTEKTGRQITIQDLEDCKTVNDLLKLFK